MVTYIQNGRESAFSNQLTAVPLIEADLISWRFDDAKNRGEAIYTQKDVLIQDTSIEMIGLQARRQRTYG